MTIDNVTETTDDETATDQPQFHPNSACYWYPKLAGNIDATQVTVPRSRFVEFEFTDAFPLLDGDVPDALPWDAFVAAVEEVGYPAFVRTDLSSAKHAGPGAYRIDEPDDIPTALAVLTDFHVEAGKHPTALMVREWADIDTAFRAFDGLQIGREVRVFASDNGPECHHFYWPESAIDDGRGTPTTLDGEQDLSDAEWRERRDDLAALTEMQVSTLRGVAMDAAFTLNLTDGAVTKEGTTWSVDFAQDVDGSWHLIDVALAEDSWHPDHEEGAD